jgi:dipeptidyl-peptidase-4
MIRFKILFATLFISALGYAQATKTISLADIFTNKTFTSKSPADLKSMKDGEHYCVKEGDSVFEYDYLNGLKTRWLFCTKDIKLSGSVTPLAIDDFEFSADETKILVKTDKEMIYRRSFIANYYVFVMASKQVIPVSKNGKQEVASFSPDGSYVGFVRDNNLFFTNIGNGVEEQVTKDGLLNNIINGKSDWVYEEEFSFGKAYSWSPESNKIAYYRFDESKVKEYGMTKWGDLYPENYQYKYPKAGEEISKVSIHVYNLLTKSTQSMDIGKETDQYIPRIKWTKVPDILSIYRMNRHQNKLEMLFADALQGSSKVIYSEENKNYIDINDNLYFADNKKFFLITSEKDGFNHIYLYGMDGKLIRQITYGNYEVDEIKGFDAEKRIIYYTSAEISPMQRDLFSINLDGTKKKRLTKENGWNTVDFSSNFNYYVLHYSNANTPAVHSVCTLKGKVLRILEDNHVLKETAASFGFSKMEFFTFKTPEGESLNGYMIKPSNLDPSKKYPVLMNVYGGPGSQSVSDRWGRTDFYWYQMLAQKGYISVCVDNRGTGFRGEVFKKCTQKELLKLESDDQISAAKYLASLPYVDGSRIGIWGWSYGGSMAALGITKGADVFKAAIAVAPVTNWRFYNAIYTERFMTLPKENESGFDDNTPMKFAKNFKGKFLLVHGTADDNVHLQNSIELINALLKENKQFEMFFYPNKNHSLIGGTARQNLYEKMTSFLLLNL